MYLRTVWIVAVLSGLAVEPAVAADERSQNGTIYLTIVPSTRTAYVGEDVLVEVAFTNTAKQPAKLVAPTLMNGKFFLWFDIRTETGDELPYSLPKGTPAPIGVPIGAGEALRCDYNLKYAYNMMTAGTYTVRAVYDDPETQLHLESGKVSIVIVKPESEDVVSSLQIEKSRSMQVVRASGEEKVHYLIREFRGKGHTPGICRKIEAGKEMEDAKVKEAVIGSEYVGVKLSVGAGKTLLINLSRRGPEVIVTEVSHDADALSLKADDQKRFMLVDSDGKIVGVPTPTTGTTPARTTQPSTNAAK